MLRRIAVRGIEMELDAGSGEPAFFGAEDLPFLGPVDEFARAIPAAQRVTIADAAHSPQLENPPAWSAAVHAHLARVR